MLPESYKPRYGDVVFKLAGESYVVRYGVEAWDSLKRSLGVTTEIDVVRKVLTPEFLHTFLHAGLLWYYPDTTTAFVRELNDELPQEGERTFQAAAWDALMTAAPEIKRVLESAVEGAVPKDPPSAKKPTRTSSAKRR